MSVDKKIPLPEKPSEKSGKVTYPLILVILAVGFGTNFQNYTNCVINNLAEVGEKWFNQSFYDHYNRSLTDSHLRLLWSFSTSAYHFAALIGSFFIKTLGDNLGRRKSLMITSSLVMIGSSMKGFSKMANSFELFILGRFVIGLGMSFGLGLASMFVSEIAPIKYRGSCGSTLQIFFGFGSIAAFSLTFSRVMGSEEYLPIVVGVPPFVAALTQLLVLTFFAYESPRYLILTEKDEQKGLKAIKFYQGEENAAEKVRAILEEQKLKEKKHGEKEIGLMDMFRRSDLRRPLTISLLIVVGSYMSGQAAVQSFSNIMFKDAGLDKEMAEFATLGTGLCALIAPLLSMVLVEKQGRRFIIFLGYILSDVSLIALTICVLGSHRFHWPGSAMGALPCMYIFLIGTSFTNALIWIVPSELFPQKARARAVTIIFVVLSFLRLLSVVIYLPFTEWVGPYFSYLPFIACMTVSGIVLAILMPETKGKSVMEVTAMFRKLSRKISDIAGRV